MSSSTTAAKSTSSSAAAAPQPSLSTTPAVDSSSSSSSSYFVRDCSRGVCSQDCPQWCNYFIIPPPPLDDGSSSSSSRISPLMVALISVLAAAFLLLTYYTFTSRYCKRRTPRRRRHRQSIDGDELVFEEELRGGGRLHHLVHDPGSNNQPPSSVLRGGGGGGLDEQFIKSIPVFKYRRGDGLVESTECAVCLTEFKEEESLRLMPNCQHAFHPPCIDTWLKSHSSCPVCRAPMVLDQAAAAAAASALPTTTTSGTNTVTTTVSRHRIDHRGRDLPLSVIIAVPEQEGRVEENIIGHGIRPTTPAEIASSDCADPFRSTADEDGSAPRKPERGQ